jgi:hypothetical protein
MLITVPDLQILHKMNASYLHRYTARERRWITLTIGCLQQDMIDLISV